MTTSEDTTLGNTKRSLSNYIAADKRFQDVRPADCSAVVLATPPFTNQQTESDPKNKMIRKTAGASNNVSKEEKEFYGTWMLE
jgi:hypothetical protein